MTSRFDLTEKELLILESELRFTEKSLGLAYFMLLGGHLGLHRFYLGRRITGCIQLILFIISSFLYFLPPIFSLDSPVSGNALITPLLLTGITLTIWILIDLFVLPRYVRAWNAGVERELIDKMLLLRDNENIK